MTNNEIVVFINTHYNIKGICFKLGIRRDTDDIEQILYERLLMYNNTELNRIYNVGALLSFVYITVRNISLYKGNNDWTSLQTNYDVITDEIDYEDFGEYDYEKERKLQFIDAEYKTTYMKEIMKMDYYHQLYYTYKLLLRYKINRKWSLNYISRKFQIPKKKVANLIKDIKQELRNNYEKNYGLDNND